MGWTHIPDIHFRATTSDDNPFAVTKVQIPGKMSVNLPTDEWLCKNVNKMNLTLVQGYPSRTSEAGGLLRKQCVKPARSQSKWYGPHTEKKQDPTYSILSWNISSTHLNSTYLRIARQAGIATNPPLSRPISQESVRKLEKSAWESSVILQPALIVAF